MEFHWNKIWARIKQLNIFSYIKFENIYKIEKILLSVMKIVLVFSVLCYFAVIASWIFEKDEGIVIKPFETAGAGQEIDGASMANLLQYELQKVRDISKSDNKKNIKFQTKPTILVSQSGYENNYSISTILPIKIAKLEQVNVTNGQKDLENSLEQMGSISLEGSSIPIGNIILSMKELFRNRPSSISCSIQNYGCATNIIAIFHNSKDVSKTYIWQAKSNEECNETVNEHIPLLIEDLSFQITHTLGKQKSLNQDVYPQDWLTFKDLLKAQEAYRIYMVSRNIEYLNKSNDLVSNASVSEPNYKGTLRRSMLYDLGFAYLNEAKYNKSEEIFRQLSILDPEIGYFGIGVVNYEINNYKKALLNIDKVITLNSTNAYAWLIKGIIFTSMKEHIKAIDSFNEAIDRNPYLEWAWFFKGLNEFKRDNTNDGLEIVNMKDALYSFNRTINLDRNNSWALFSRGRILRDGDRHDLLEAFDLFNKTIKLDPSNAFAWNERGNSFYIIGIKGDPYLRLTRLEQAIVAKDIALELSPKSWNIWYDKGLVLLASGNCEKAIPCFDKALSLVKDKDNWNKINDTKSSCLRS